MVQRNAVWVDEFLGLVTREPIGDDHQIAGAEVRYRYVVPSDKRDAARAYAARVRENLLAQGAVLVKVEEEVLTVGRARQPEIAAALTLDDKLGALWDAQKNAPAAERRPRLLSKVHELEEETNAA